MKLFYQIILRALKLNIKVLNIIGVLNCHLTLYWISLKYACKLQKPVYNFIGKVLPKGKSNLKKNSKANFFFSLFIKFINTIDFLSILTEINKLNQFKFKRPYIIDHILFKLTQHYFLFMLFPGE